YSVPLAEQALFLRVKGLVSWELGRPDEGAHHLEEAVRLFSEARAVEDEGATLTLLGLLYAEEGEASPCLGALLAGLSLLAGAQRPWLAARGCFTLAGNLADSGCREEAWGALRRGLEHAGAVEDPAEAAFLRWLEGTALGSVGEAAQARELLRQAQARYLGEGRLAEAALASLDLALVLAEAGTTLETGRLAEELEERFPGAREAGEAATALRRTRWSDPKGPRRSVDTVTSPLRRLFRMGRHRPRPIPFV
ncbi:MAG TPA: hypothetical protein VN493_06500, partial [Thermoanaerobaculia bacterium]|nr:hypothetical protein [Thermoanaerobaculia bacterium]